MTPGHNYLPDESSAQVPGFPEQQRAIIFSRDGRKCMNITIAKPPTPPSLNIEPVDIFLDTCPPPAPTSASTSTKKKKKRTKNKKKGDSTTQPDSTTVENRVDACIEMTADSSKIPTSMEMTKSISSHISTHPVHPEEGASKKKKKKHEEGQASLQQHSHPLNNFPDTSNDAIWNSDNSEERQRIRDFWLHLGEEERRALVKVEKEAVLRRMKEERDPCPCARCGQKRQALEDELEVLYDAYYDELEQYANHQQQYLACENQSDCSEEEYEVEFEEEEVVEYEDSDEEEEETEHNSAYFDLGDSLKIKGGILTVADDLIKNDGKRFLAMMERLANRSVRKEETPSVNDSRARMHHESGPPSSNISMDGEVQTDGDRSLDEGGKDDQSIDENRRMFQVFAARMFEQRVLTAYREKIAQDRQQKLLQELEEENRLQREKEERRLRKQEKKKEKRRQLKEQKEQERLKKEEELRLKEEALKAQREAQRKKKEEERLRKEEQRRQEERLRLEAERKAKAQEDKARKEREAKEQEEKNRRAKAEKSEPQLAEEKHTTKAPSQLPTKTSSLELPLGDQEDHKPVKPVADSHSNPSIDPIILNGASPVRPYYQVAQAPYGFLPTSPVAVSPLYKPNRASAESESVTRKLSELTLQSCLTYGTEAANKPSNESEPSTNTSEGDQKRGSVSSTLESIFSAQGPSVGVGGSSNSHFPSGVSPILPFALNRPPLGDATLVPAPGVNPGSVKEVNNGTGVGANTSQSEFDEIPSKVIRPPQSKVIARPSPIQQPRNLPTSSEYSHLSSPSIASFGLPKVWNAEADSPPVSHSSPTTSPISQPSSLFSGPLFGSLMENQPTAPNPPPAFDSSSTPSSNHSMPGFSRMGHGWNPPTNASELFRKEIGSDWASRQGLWFTHPMAPQVYSDSSRGYIQDPMVVLWDQIRQAYYRLESRQGVQSLHQLASNFYSLIELKNTHVELFGESATDEAKIFEACQVGNRWSQSTGQGLFIFKQDPSQPNIILARFEEPITNPLRQPPAPNMPSLPRGVVPMVHPLNPQAGLYGDAYLDSIMTHNYPTASNVANIFGPPPPTSSRKASGPSTSNVDLGVNGVLS